MLKKLRSRVVILSLAILLTSCAQPIKHSESPDKSGLHSLYLAMRSLDASVLVGAPFDQYSTNLTAACAQLLIENDSSPTDQEQRNILAEYAIILEKYQDALYVWSLAIQGGKGGEPRLIAIQQKFGIKTVLEGNLFEGIRNQLWEQCNMEEKNLLPALRTAGVL